MLEAALGDEARGICLGRQVAVPRSCGPVQWHLPSLQISLERALRSAVLSSVIRPFQFYRRTQALVGLGQPPALILIRGWIYLRSPVSVMGPAGT